ncbi:hypothetical protein ACFQY0_19905 [Haloferula chungangensis]|uniref:DNRLRE domain-containing protein n=1 Tax=Haloferula chungangensis TaxID=1048331 RepID=A0ABW2LAJ0_9BACT
MKFQIIKGRCLVGALGLFVSLSLGLDAQSVTLEPVDTAVTDNLSPANVGATASTTAPALVNGGVSGEFVIRERSSAAQSDRRISSYFLFDLTDPSVEDVLASPLFTATLSVDYVGQLNTVNGAPASIGRVTTAAWDSSSNPPLHSYGLEGGVGTQAADVMALIDNIAATPAAGETVSLDVTEIVRSWIDGVNPNYGFVLFINQLTSQGAGFDHPQLVLAVPPDDDNDGMPNDWEIANSTPENPLDPNDGADATVDNDSDGGPDGLTNLEEFRAGTNPQDSDSDDDLLLDGAEVNGTLNPYQTTNPGDASTAAPGLATDPLDADSDDDGLTDFEELNDENGSISNPWTNDTDGDTLLDPYEVASGLDPVDSTGDNGRDGDPDLDDFYNDEEQEAGTNPHRADTDGDLLDDPTEYFNEGTNPLDPDTDGDNLTDKQEVDGDTDPLSADSDSDTFLDSVEIAAGTDPNLFEETPTLATITWTASALDSEYDLITNGPLVLAENCNGPAATVNGIPFAGAIDSTTYKSTPNFVTLITSNAGGDEFYDDEVPALSPLLETVWTGSSDETVSIFGLTPGLPYVIQVGRADDRNFASIPGRFYTIDGVGGEVPTDPVGPTNTIFGGVANPAVLFTGTFVATEPVQSFDVRQFNTAADPTGAGANVINFIQVRQTDDVSTSQPSAVQIVSTGFNGGSFEIGFGNLDTSKTYQLSRSANLGDGFPEVVDGPRVPTASSEVFKDDSPLTNQGFYVLEEVAP